MIDAYLVSNLQESLGLTDDQFVKLLPLVKRLQTDRRSFQQRRMQALRDLRQLLRSGTATESRIEALLGEVKAVEAEEPSAIKKHLDAIDATLDPVQQAKYRVLEVEVEQKLRQILAEARRQNRPAAPGPRRGRQAEPPP
jgi:Spy/CpxP family protein refolding chaperone